MGPWTPPPSGALSHYSGHPGDSPPGGGTSWSFRTWRCSPAGERCPGYCGFGPGADLRKFWVPVLGTWPVIPACRAELMSRRRDARINRWK